MRVDPNYLNYVASAIQQSTGAESALTTELSSGLRVTSLQVDPSAVATSALLGSAIARDDSYVRAATSRQGQLQVTDSTLGEVVTQVTAAISLAVQGSNGTGNTGNYQTLAQQLIGIRNHVLALANTSYLGNYLFSGSQGAVAPFSLDTTTSPATAVYAGDNAAQVIKTPTGQQIQVNLPGSVIFGSTAGAPGVLDALNQLIADFSGGAPSTTAAADTAALTASLTQVSLQRSVLNTLLNRINQTSTYAQTEQSQLTAQQGTLMSADLTSIATQLKAAETQHQALLAVMSSLGSTNLFSYMK